jgi:hypothetical protein
MRYLAVAAGQIESYALRSDGTIVCWGSQGHGLNSPPTLAPGFAWGSLSAGAAHTLGLAVPAYSIESFCAGDGSGSACPCGNPGSAGNGCANSIGSAHLEGLGVASVSGDWFVLSGTGMPDSGALYFQGTTEVNGGAGAAFGDGLRCAGGIVIRLGARINTAHASSYPGVGDLPISIRGAVPSEGATRVYQAWYRNLAGQCGTGQNLTNGVVVAWAQ